MASPFEITQTPTNRPEIPWRAILGLVFWVGICFIAAGLGSTVTETGQDSWYRALEKPAWQPPDSAFGIVWTILYTLMGVAAWRVWRKAGSFQAARLALTLFIVQLALNTVWSYVFFGLEQPGLAFIEIVALWGVLAATILRFWRWERLAGVLLLPYIAWVTYAAALNFAIWLMN